MAELFHVGLTVSELDRSLAFYRDVVGLEVLSTVDVDSDGYGGVDVTSEIESVVPGIRSFYVTDPDGVPVEFIERPS